MNGEQKRFVLLRVDARYWQILDRRYLPTDTRHAVAWIRETGEGRVRVDWSRATPLPVVYGTAIEALDDFRRWTDQSVGGGSRSAP